MVNKVILVGNVGIDPEVRTTESGVKVARIRLATTERLFDRQANEAKEHTEWHTVTLWRGPCRRGRQICPQGNPDLRSRGACAPASGWTRIITSVIRPRYWPM